MKKVIYLLLLVPFLFLQSCVEEEKDIFDTPANQRLTEALKKYQETLLSAPNGWIMEYYPESTQMYGGYNFLLSFNEKGEVTVSSEITSPTDSVTSLYRLIAETGPVLTFDTYNEIFHFFSQPGENNKQEGYAGDYEFIFMNVTNENIILKGKKSGNTYVMTPLAAEIKWPDYLERILEMPDLVTAPSYQLLVGDKTASFEQNWPKIIITYDVDAAIEQQEVAFMYTAQGIKLYEPVEIFGKTMQEFRLADDQNSLICLEDESIKIVFVYPPLNEAFAQTKQLWTVEVSDFNTTMRDWWEQTAAITLIDQGEILQDMYLGYYKGNKGSGTIFRLQTDAYAAIVGVDYIPSEGTENEISFHINGTDLLNYSFYKDDYQPFLDFIASSSPFKMEADNPLHPTTITFTSKTNSDVTFTVSK